MPIIHPVSDNSGTEYPEAYWRFTGFEFKDPQRLAVFVFSAWPSRQKYIDGKPPIHGVERSVTLNSSEYDHYMSQELTKQMNMKEIAHAVAQARELFPDGVFS